MLRALRGRRPRGAHRRVACCAPTTGDQRWGSKPHACGSRITTTRRSIAYVKSGEPLDKAGAYGIQGGGAELAAEVDGLKSNVVGLPVERLAEWLDRIGIDPAALPVMEPD